MPKSKKLHQQIASKLDELSKLLDNIDEVRIIQAEDSDTWDSDTLARLVTNLKKTLQLLEDKKSPKENEVSAKQKDPWGEPLILEAGLGTLVDEYHEENEDNEE